MESIPVWDIHADVLWRMVMEKIDFFQPASPLSAGWHQLQRGGVRVQGFPLFVPSTRPAVEGWNVLLEQLVAFHDRIVGRGAHVVPLLYREDAVEAGTGTAVHGLLCLEGCYALEGSIERLALCMHLGVRVIGLTWNEANLLADGVGESRGGGLTALGRQFVKEVWQRSGIIDVAHLSEAAFWEVIREARGPVICSHANVKAVWPHRRNLSDAQLRALAEVGGVLGLTFVPDFVGPRKNLDDFLHHVDHALGLVGDRHVAFGSDFDGTVDRLDGLETASDFSSFKQILVDRYGTTTARRLLWENWKCLFSRFLPPRPHLRETPF